MIYLALLTVLLSTQCKQDFTFLGTTDWEHSVFWIVEDVSGECHFSRLVQVSVQDSIASFTQTYFANYKETQNFSHAFSEFHPEPFQEFKRQGADLATPSCVIQPPSLNDSLYEDFSFDGNYVPHTWNSKMGTSGMVMPTIQNRSSKLLYAYPRGLYVNYQLDRAFLVSTKNLLIVFTKNPSLGTGGDSMDGFLIFKLQP